MVDIWGAKYLEYHVYWLKLEKKPQTIMLTFFNIDYLMEKNINWVRYLLLAPFIRCVI